jgi:hypothetical protein
MRRNFNNDNHKQTENRSSTLNLKRTADRRCFGERECLRNTKPERFKRSLLERERKQIRVGGGGRDRVRDLRDFRASKKNEYI